MQPGGEIRKDFDEEGKDITIRAFYYSNLLTQCSEAFLCKSASISLLVNSLVVPKKKKKTPNKYCDILLMVSVIFLSTIVKHVLVPVLFFCFKCEHLLLFFVIYDSTRTAFRFWTVRWTKKQYEDLTLGSGKMGLGFPFSQLFDIIQTRQFVF